MQDVPRWTCRKLALPFYLSAPGRERMSDEDVAT